MSQYSVPRTSRRIPLAREVRLKFERFDRFVTEMSSNLSMGGMFVTTEDPPPEGTVVDLEFELGDDTRLIRGRGRVVWRREGGESPGMGIRFLELSPGSRQLIFRVVDGYIQSGGEPFDLESGPRQKTPLPPRPGAAPGEAAGAPGGRAGAVGAAAAASAAAGAAVGETRGRQAGAPAAASGRSPAAPGPRPAAEAAPTYQAAAAPGGMPEPEELPDVAPEIPAPLDDLATEGGGTSEAEAPFRTGDLPVAPAGGTLPADPVPVSATGTGAAASGDREVRASSYAALAPAARGSAAAKGRGGSRRLLWLVAGSLLLAVTALGVWLFLQRPAGPEREPVEPSATGAAADVDPDEPAAGAVGVAGAGDEVTIEEVGGEPGAAPVEPGAANAGAPSGEATAAAAEPDGSQPSSVEPAAPPAPAASAEPLTSFRGVEQRRAGEATEVVLVGDGSLDASRIRRERLSGEPPREVVRISGVDRPLGSPNLEVGNRQLLRVRTGHHPGAGGGSLHVVLDLADPGVRLTGVSPRDGRLVLRLEGP